MLIKFCLQARLSLCSLSLKVGVMKLTLAVAALVSVTLASSVHQDHDKLQFARFREQFGKTYHTRSEHTRRFSIFQQNLRKYEQHNKSGASWTMGNTLIVNK